MSQLTKTYTEKYKNYRDALELYDKEKFSAAQEKFATVISEINNQQDEIQVSAEYLHAVCALNLFHTDAQYLLSEFARNHPDSPKTRKIFFLLANDFYRRKKWKDAIEWYEKVDAYDLTKDEKTAYFFKKGYSYFVKEKFAKAKAAFYKIKDNKESDYYAPTQYYYSHISYTDGNYQTALEGFKNIESNPGFAPIVPYYVAQILFKQAKYKQVTEYVPSILAKEKVKRKAEIKGILGSSFFKQKEYKKAIPELEYYFKKTKKKSIDDYYQLGFSYYKNEDYKKAIKYLGRVASKRTSRAQVVNYLLAECYIKTDKKAYAKAAFKRAYDLGFNSKINEDALFGYAKTTYELTYNPYDEATGIFHTFLEKYPTSTKKEQVYEYLLDVYTTTKNYKAALNSLNRIKDKNFKLKEAHQKLSFNRATELFYKRNYREAISTFKNVNTYPVNTKLTSQSAFWIAEANYRMKNYAKAIDGFKKFKSMPGAISGDLSQMADYNIGYAYFKQKKYTESNTAFRNFIKNTTDKAKESDANLRLGDAYFIKKEDDKAVKYYQRAIDLNQENVDYAIYQKSVSAGYKGDYEERERLLNLLLTDYPNSNFSTNTVFELANNYRVQNKNAQALKFYKQIIDNQGETYQKRKAMLEIGGIHLREQNYSLAEKSFTNLVKKYPKSLEGEAAINELEKSYLAQNKIADFPDLLTSLGIKYSQSKLDSTLWQPANQAYLNADCNNAINGLTAYLTKIENPKHEVTANFYIAECKYVGKEFDQALVYYKKVIDKNEKHMVDALFHAGNLTFKNKNYTDANTYFSSLEKINTDELKIPVMNKGLMITNYNLKNYADAIIYSGKVLAEGNLSRSQKERAYVIKANSNYELGYMAEAEISYEKIIKLSTDIDKAIAKYRTCEITFAGGDYKKTEKKLFEFLKQKPSYDYWLAKGYILLSDCYVKLDDNFQAKATLQSVIDNYNGEDEIIDVCKAKLEAIKTAENTEDNGEEEGLEIEVK